MRIQHNIAALNSHRQLTNNNSAVGKNLEKLSSGYRINRAGDDAAGLAISEKMRAQITGLDTAQKNAQDGISLVQTAEGALTEVHSMLNRMAELADQSANGTYQDLVDRQNIQKEYESLRDEVDRISQGTNFNGIKLLDGTLGGGGAAATAPTVVAKVAGADVNAVDSPATKGKFTTGALVHKTDNTSESIAIKYTDKDGKEATANITYTTGTDDASSATALLTALNADSGLKAAFKITGDESGIIFESITAGAGKESIASVGGGTNATIATGTNVKGTDKASTYDLSGTFKDGDSVKIGNEEYTFKTAADGSDGKTFKDLAALKAAVDKNGTYTIDVSTATKVKIDNKADAGAGAGGGLTLQIGESSEAFNQLSVSVKSMSTASLGIDSLDLGTQGGAQQAIDLIKTAINTVSSTRGDLGAIQNRLEHTINNLGVTSENMSAAESRIRDVDMAQEMMNFTKNNILTQASQAMLAQANQLPQGVLQLLQ